MNPQLKSGFWLNSRSQDLDYPAQSACTEQQRLAAMQDDLEAGQPVRGRVLGEPLSYLVDCCPAKLPGLDAPTLVGVLVHVAVITGEVAAAMYLEHVLGDRRGHSAVRCRR